MTQGHRGWPRLVALLSLVALLVTACSNTVNGAPVPVVIPPPSAAESIAQSLLNLGEAGAAHYKGTFTSASDEKVTFDVTVSSAGDVLGSITADGNPAT
ncbi:MAG TPA: hypothetical protein VGR06_08610, partial [Actinophytocola sp.]|uniref:hypothetical protein n=1 Tax=Actinophytocola sp. TaxID=1872138 RepID=UPI002DFEAA79|nr:hypothetical protein [Actinophytocola sp.]